MPRKKVSLSTAEKIEKIIASKWKIAWDGCHKIYFLQNPDKVRNAKSNGYKVFPAKDLPDIIVNSCGLVFVSNWALDDGKWDHECNINQGDPEIVEEARKRLKE